MDIPTLFLPPSLSHPVTHCSPSETSHGVEHARVGSIVGDAPAWARSVTMLAWGSITGDARLVGSINDDARCARRPWELPLTLPAWGLPLTLPAWERELPLTLARLGAAFDACPLGSCL